MLQTKYALLKWNKGGASGAAAPGPDKGYIDYIQAVSSHEKNQLTLSM
jgi:hypothetical protein